MGCCSWSMSVVVAVALLGATTACARPVYRQLATVTALDEDRFWAVGSEQLAFYYDGERFFRHDYPVSDDAPDWAYELGYGSPPAKVVVHAGQPLLFTRVGDLFRWGHSGWTPVDLTLTPPPSYDHVQIDQVASTPQGTLLVQLHSETLLLGGLDDLVRGAPLRETTPSYFTWLDWLGDHLYGLGWDEGGKVRSLYRRDRQGWVLTSRLGRLEPDHGDPTVFALRDGTTVVVASYGLIATGSVELVASSGLVTVPARESAAAIDLPQQGTWIAHGFAGAPGRALLLLGSGGQEGVNAVELRNERWVRWRCPADRIAEAVGAYPRPEGWRVVTESPSPWSEPDHDPLQRVGVLDLPSADCQEQAPLRIAH